WRAASAASGDIVAVVDTEAWPLAGWLPPLVHLLDGPQEAGIATSLLLTPDGTVAAECALDESRMEPHGEDPGSIAHSHVRRVQREPAKVFATRKDVFLDRVRVWGRNVDPPAKFCAAAQDEGLPVLRQPMALAVVPWPQLPGSVLESGGG